MSDAPNDSSETPKDGASEAKGPDAKGQEAEGQPSQSRESSSFFRRRASLRSSGGADAPPPPPPRRKREGTLSALSSLLSLLLVVAVAGVFGLIAVLHKLREPGPLAAEKIVYIAPHSDVPEIMAQLERDGVIDNPMLMNIALLIEGVRGKLKPGEYAFKQNASLREVMDELINGRQILHGVTIPEGLTTDQIVSRLRESDVLAGDMAELPKEGALLPETYKVARGYPRAKLLLKMQEDQRKLLDQIWARRNPDLPVKTPFELVTLASIVEKETGKADERPRVAAVFVNRLRKGMRLQSDPTIVYGLVGGRATLGRGILKSEVEKWTPYNTYAIEGLPPGPIANPGRAALEAVANPSRTQELYFVADGTGGHVFAETLEQHSRNVQRWRQIEKDRALGVDRLEPGAVVGPTQPAPREKRGDAAFGRLVALADAQMETVTAADPRHGALKRIGAALPSIPFEYAGDNEESLRLTAERAAVALVAPPLFTTQFAQRAQPEARAAVTMIAAAADDSQAGSDELAEDDGLDSASYPVSAALRAEQRARAARLGLAVEERPVERPLPLSASADAGQPPRAARARAFDASEGTALDPLRDRGWDLNSAKTVPDVAKFR
ncbi:aminodeoxychorismate lyase [Methylosinus sp. R-45379]|uniref:endolytic transglycosylase MltG n=1 Tax=Methylosinus sp. R-45379 TaxID=980563 RepID=UPI0007C93394|nr:endolytic transglycosylase MltG [Methylosinus sp. R-45379]OAI24911.1 aminodeoxychorismate lyase [Methylosinus sp. R-45379]